MSNTFLPGNKTIITLDGGYAIRMINDTGEASVKGKVVHASVSIEEAASLVPVDNPDPIGVIYTADIAIGGYMYVTIAGRAEVLFGTTTTKGLFARASVAADSVAAGLAVGEALPTPPFATDKHFQEIGHILETIGAPGLALCALHFN